MRDTDSSPADPRPPGRRILTLLGAFVSRETYESVFVQVYRDLREEWEAAAADEGRWSTLRVRMRGYVSFLSAAGAQFIVTAAAALDPAPSKRGGAEAGGGPNRRLTMRTVEGPNDPTLLSVDTANDRFKQSFESRVWGSIIVATALHLLAFTLFPTLTAADASPDPDVMTHIEPPPDVDVPDAPPPLTRPALPVATDDVPADVTIPVNVPGDGGFEELPPPPTSDRSTRDAGPAITPWTVRPEVKNLGAVARALEREYPRILRDAGIGGTVVVWFFIDEGGAVRETRLHETSGQPALDDAALEIADVFEFTPALNMDEAVPVWIQLPVVFEAR